MVKEISKGLWHLIETLNHDLPDWENPVSLVQRPNPRIMACEDVIKAADINTITLHGVNDRPYYHEGTDCLGIHHISRFKSSWLYYSTAFHEICHSTGNKHRLCRNMGNRRNSTLAETQTEEVTAEIGSFCLSVVKGFDDKILLKSARYIQYQDKANFKKGVENGLKAAKYLLAMV